VDCAAATLPVTVDAKNGTVTFSPPAGYGHLAVASPTPEATIDDIKTAGTTIASVKWFNAFMDARPELAIVETKAATIHVFSYKNRLLSVASAGGVTVVAPQALLLYFLSEAHRAAGPARAMFAQYYVWTLEILKAAVAQAKSLEDFTAKTPYSLSVQTLGKINQDVAFRIRMFRAVRETEGKNGADPPAALNLGTMAELEKLTSGLPPDYFSGRTRPPPFDYSKNELFMRDGRERQAAATTH